MEKESNKFTVNITPESFLKCILIVLLIWFLFYIKDIVLVVLTAVILASGMEPLINWFKKFKIRRLPAAIISYIGLIGLLSGLLFLFLPAVLDETSSFLATLPQYLDSATLWNPTGITSTEISQPQKVVAGISEGIDNPTQLVKDISSQTNTATKNTSFGIGDIIQGIQNITSNSNGYITIISTVFGGIFSFLLIIFFSFYFFFDVY